MGSGMFVVLSAPSGCGKTTIKNRLMALQRFVFSVSYTTRQPRSGEVHGVDYYFLTVEEFQHKIDCNEFIEYALVHGSYYGTGGEYLRHVSEGQDVLLDIDVQGGAQIKKTYPLATSIFIMPPSLSVLEQRLLQRHTETAESAAKRLMRAREEIKCYEHYDYCVVNDNLEQAIADILAIVRSEHLKTFRWEVDTDAFYYS